MKRKRKSSLERKITSTLVGMKCSTTAQLKKLEKVKIKKKLPQVPVSNFYARTKGVWVDKGLSCRLCGVLLSNNQIIEKHRYICKVLKDKDVDVDD